MSEIKPKNYTNAWVNAVSITMFFISFFTAFFTGREDTTVAFVKAIVVMFITHIFSKILVLIWQFTIPREQWMLAVHGHPEVLSRSQRRQAAIEAALAAEAEAAAAAEAEAAEAAALEGGEEGDAVEMSWD